MHLTVSSPLENMYSGEVRSVQLPGQDGLFEILDRHAPIVALLQKGEVRIVDTNGEETRLNIDRGIFEIKNNQASLLII